MAGSLRRWGQLSPVVACLRNDKVELLDGFKRFVKQKTEQLKRDQRCQNVEYIVEVENGKVSLKAKGA